MKNYDIYRDYGQVDISIIEEFEKTLGLRLPDLYKKLLSRHDAFIPEKNIFDFQVNNESHSSDVNFLGFGENLNNYKSIRSGQEYDDYAYEKIVVIGRAANGDYICFDYRENLETSDPPMVIMLHDYPDENDKMLVCGVADSFQVFMDSLHGDDE